VALRQRAWLRYRNGLLLAWVSTAKISGKLTGGPIEPVFRTHDIVAAQTTVFATAAYAGGAGTGGNRPDAGARPNARGRR